MDNEAPAKKLEGNDPEQYHADWSSLPADSLAAVVGCGVLSQHEVGVVRLVCHTWCHNVTATLTKLVPRCQTREQLDQLPTRFPLLTHLDLHKFDHALLDHTLLYQQSQQLLAVLADKLSRLPSLSHITFSAECAAEMGRKSWAAWMAATVTTPSFLAKQSTTPNSEPSHTTHTASRKEASGSGSKVKHEHNTTAPGVSAFSSLQGPETEQKSKGKAKGMSQDAESFHVFVHRPALTVSPRKKGSASWQLPTCGSREAEEDVDILETHVTSAKSGTPACGPSCRDLSGDPGLGHLSWAEWLWLESHCKQPSNWDKSILWMPSWLSQLKGVRSLSICPNDVTTPGPKASLLFLPNPCLTQLLSIDLSNCALAQLPPAILAIPQLTTLILRGCKLQKLQSDVSKMTNLTHLDVSDNQLKKLPAQLGQLTSLKELLASRNMLSLIPRQALAGLSHLSHLDLSNNQLPEPPAGLRECRRLRRLRLSHNWLKGLATNGAELCCMGGLSMLEVVNVSDVSNPLALPAEVVLLSNLKALDLSDNIISPAALQRLEDLTALTRLMLHGLKVDGPCPQLLQEIPPQVSRLTGLKHLVVSRNAIRSFPSFLSRMTNLQYLDISSNGISNDHMASTVEAVTCVPQLRALKLMGNEDLDPPAGAIQDALVPASGRDGMYCLSLEKGDFWMKHNCTAA